MGRRTALICLAIAAVGAPAIPASAAGAEMRWRGIVEGPYGSPWTHRERMDVLRWMPAHGFNAYVHAPKDDLYQRTNWRDPYPARQQREFEREIQLARRTGVEWVPNLSPALPLIPTPAVPGEPPSRDLCFSCPADLEAVVEKLRPFLDAGARTSMISFDDVTKTLTHPEDLAAYGAGDEAFGRANGDFLTRLDARLRELVPGARLLTVGADYSGTEDTAYLRGLRAALAPGIEVMWTGTGVPSEHWKPADADAYAELIGRTPAVWENWTNNDTAGNATPLGTARLFLGPYRRTAATADAVSGFFFNPMNEAHLNLLPLATAGDWMADPERYRARSSWAGAIRELAPGIARAATLRRRSLRAWAEVSWSNKLDRRREAPTFVERSSRFLDRYVAGGGWPRSIRRLVRELRLVELAPARLRRLPYEQIAEQAAEFLEAARKTARAGRLAARLLAAERPLLELGTTGQGFAGRAAPPDPERASEVRAALDEAELQAEADSEFTYGWRTPAAFEIPPYAVPNNVMNDFIERVRELDAEWRESASEAASRVEVRFDGRPLRLDEQGRFRLPAYPCHGQVIRLVAEDGAGGRTVRALSCEARPTVATVRLSAPGGDILARR